MDHDCARESPIGFSTDRLTLRPWRVTDAHFERALWMERDPRVPPHRRIGSDGRPTVGDLEDRLRRYDGQPAPGLLVAEHRTFGKRIGYCGLLRRDGEPADSPELAFELLQEFWNQGLATEASRAIVENAQALGYRQLTSTVRAWNSASLRVLEKVGFARTGQVEPNLMYGNLLTLGLTL